MKTSSHGISLIKRYEGFRAEPYFCPAGYLTIGYGHVIKANEKFESLSEEEAEQILQKDLLIFERSVARLVHAPINQYQFDALVSFTYNLGQGALQRSTLRQVINRHEYELAPNEFRKWIYAGGRILKGLIRRRNSEAIMFEAGSLL